MVVVFVDSISNKPILIQSNKISNEYKPMIEYGLKGFSNKNMALRYFNNLSKKF